MIHRGHVYSGPPSATPAAIAVTVNPSRFRIPSHWWGKIILGVIGLFRGGIAGALLGVIVGHWLDRMIAGFLLGADTRGVFFKALFCTLGQVAKADGRVGQQEVDAAERLMARMKLSADARREAIAHFRDGREGRFEPDALWGELYRRTVMREDLRYMFMELLLETAAADGRLHAAERDVIVAAARHLHIPAAHLDAMLNARAGFGGAGAGPRTAAAGVPLHQAYATLGVSADASDAEVKRAYRKLVARYHPDRLGSQGLPEEMEQVARTRIADINTAWDRIKEARGIK